MGIVSSEEDLSTNILVLDRRVNIDLTIFLVQTPVSVGVPLLVPECHKSDLKLPQQCPISTHDHDRVYSNSGSQPWSLPLNGLDSNGRFKPLPVPRYPSPA
jgi:hypothetical protein